MTQASAASSGVRSGKPGRKAEGPRTRAERTAAGKALRDEVPRTRHAEWKIARRDPVAILQRSNRGRVPHLVPIRFARMLQSPFTVLRGSAAVMAYDLARTPVSGLSAQLCGDCHLSNFGLFATPERQLVFDINDFDETNPGPWEWDLKRLAASFVVAARDNRLPEGEVRDIVLQLSARYRDRMRAASRMSPTEVWYAQIGMQALIDAAHNAESRRFRRQLAQQARKRIIEHHYPKIVARKDGHHRFADEPPVLFHVTEDELNARLQDALLQYRLSLPDSRRVLLDRYHLEDFAFKVVGIGSVGTRCAIALLMSDDEQQLILQFKEAGRSAIEPYTERSRYENQGQRVVVGQRLMQSSSDIFLGWARGTRGNDFYVRQLRDMKMSVPLVNLNATQLGSYARLCGWTLARAHAKTADAATISGYMGKGDTFDRALARFARAYADQTEKDYAALVRAARSGRIEVASEG